MRFFIAIGVLAVAAVLLATGVIQKIFFGGPEFDIASDELATSAPYVIISGDDLGGHDSAPNVVVSGTKQTFVGYGRTEDVMAWIGDDRYEVVSIDENKVFSIETGKQQKTDDEVVVPDEQP